VSECDASYLSVNVSGNTVFSLVYLRVGDQTPIFGVGSVSEGVLEIFLANVQPPDHSR
jgi:hypothetical protein